MNQYEIALAYLFVRLIDVSAKVDTLRENMVTKEDLKETLKDFEVRVERAIDAGNDRVRIDLLKAINHQTLTLVAIIVTLVGALVVVPRLWP